MSFDTFLMVDWSGGNDRGRAPKKDAIWVCAARKGIAQTPVYLRNRQVAESWIADFLGAERNANRRVLAGFDFAFGYPKGFGKTLTGTDDPFSIWDWFAARVDDTPKPTTVLTLQGRSTPCSPALAPFGAMD
ncbi:hypothetical protein [Yoonia sp. GPGPB17]|uniref:hypothetical protein n=1 Tax=Yoonia sp. GPGPB17 TaxID=3026147 RepID=UPI0030EDB912